DSFRTWLRFARSRRYGAKGRTHPRSGAALAETTAAPLVSAAIRCDRGRLAPGRPGEGAAFRGCVLMPLARVYSVALLGIDGRMIEIEAGVGAGLPGTTLLGLPDGGLREAKDRVRAAVRNSGFSWPDQHVTLGLSPVSLPKIGAGYDLGIAVATLAAAGMVPTDRLAWTVLLGGPALEGRLRGTPVLLPALLAAREAGMTRAVGPVDSLGEARLLDGIQIGGAENLAEVLAWLRDEDELTGPGVSPHES